MAVILAGGASRRFGQDKASVEVDGAPALVRVAMTALEVAHRVAVVGEGGPDLPPVFIRVPDLEPGGGPLQAVLAAAARFAGADLLVLGCDMPWVTPEALRLLSAPLPHGKDARVAVICGEPQPLAALYGDAARWAFHAVWTGGQRSLRRVLPLLQYEPLTELVLWQALVLPEVFDDFDTPEDLTSRRAGT
ncbi:MAG: molybdenum cofactor guanylyltransferase [Armatimonadetes bacterium]|nr:molybdenum cofactor guanylyltransferase [Armatimonadota bacterium]